VSDAAGTLRPCSGCGAGLPPSLLLCPGCGRLVHAESLKTAAAAAAEHEGRGDLTAAQAAWRQALALLPAATVQHGRVTAEIARLGERIAAAGSVVPAPAAAAPGGGRRRAGWLGGLSAAGLLLAKFKWALLFLLGKAKLLLLGLGQLKTFASMALAMGVYASAFGWRFGVGLIVSIYIHEMGHVAALRRYGIPASAPMFIPGFGAFVRLKQHPATHGEDARIGLAGPLWGTAAAAICLVVGRAAGWPSLLAIARAGAWINLFNLAPVWQLDGGRGFSPLSRRQRAFAAAALGILAVVARDGLLLLIALAAAMRAAGKAPAPPGDRPVVITYVSLAGALTALFLLAGR
jgi:Zn-dependent protease